MALKEKLDEIKNVTDELLDYANDVTGESDVRLGDAILTLANGFGGGGGLTPYQTIDVEVPADMLGSGVVDFKAPINEGITFVVLRNKKEFPREKEFIIATKIIYVATGLAVYSGGINLTGEAFNGTNGAVITIPYITVSTKIANMRLSSNANNYIYAGLYTLEFYQL